MNLGLTQIPIYDMSQAHLVQQPLAQVSPAKLVDTIHFLGSAPSQGGPVIARVHGVELSLSGSLRSQKSLQYELTKRTCRGSIQTLIHGAYPPTEAQPLELSQEVTLYGLNVVASDEVSDDYERLCERLYAVIRWSLRFYTDLIGTFPGDVHIVAPSPKGISMSLELPFSEDLDGFLARAQGHGRGYPDSELRMFINSPASGISLHIYYADDDELFRVELIQPLSPHVLEIPAFNELAQMV